jgi:hypothetical protein
MKFQRLSRLLYEKGADDRTRPLIEEAGHKAIAFQLDRSKPENVERLFKEVGDKLGTSTTRLANS